MSDKDKQCHEKIKKGVIGRARGLFRSSKEPTPFKIQHQNRDLNEVSRKREEQGKAFQETKCHGQRHCSLVCWRNQ